MMTSIRHSTRDRRLRVGSNHRICFLVVNIGNVRIGSDKKLILFLKLLCHTCIFDQQQFIPFHYTRTFMTYSLNNRVWLLVT